MIVATCLAILILREAQQSQHDPTLSIHRSNATLQQVNATQGAVREVFRADDHFPFGRGCRSLSFRDERCQWSWYTINAPDSWPQRFRSTFKIPNHPLAFPVDDALRMASKGLAPVFSHTNNNSGVSPSSLLPLMMNTDS